MHGSWDGRRGDAQTQSKESGSFGFLKEMAKLRFTIWEGGHLRKQTANGDA